MQTGQKKLEELGLSAKLAKKVAQFYLLSHIYDAVYIASMNKFDALATADVYFQVGEVFGLSNVVMDAKQLPVENDWQRRAVSMLIEEIYASQAALTEMILKSTKGKKMDPEKALTTWYQKNEPVLEPIEDILANMKDEPLSVASLTVFNGQVRSLLAKLEDR